MSEHSKAATHHIISHSTATLLYRHLWLTNQPIQFAALAPPPLPPSLPHQSNDACGSIVSHTSTLSIRISFLYFYPSLFICVFPPQLYSPPLPPPLHSLFYIFFLYLLFLALFFAATHNSFLPHHPYFPLTLPSLLPFLPSPFSLTPPLHSALYRPACMLLPLDDAYVLGSLTWRTASRRCSY